MEERRYLDDLVVRGARIFSRDFAGVKYEQGKRGFCLKIEDPSLAEKMAQDGWNVKQFDPEKPGDEPTYFINVKVSYKVKEPIVKMISNGNVIDLHENDVDKLDRVKIAKVDVVVHPNYYDFGKGANRKVGFAAYLNEIWVTVRNDSVFANEYASQYDEDTPFGDVE